MIERVELTPPIDPGYACRHCYEPIVAVAIVRDGLMLRQVDWRHGEGLRRECRSPRPAEPPHTVEALIRVEALAAARQGAGGGESGGD